MNILGNILVYTILGLLALVFCLGVALLIKKVIKWHKKKKKEKSQ